MTIDKRDFDANRPLLQDIDAEQDTADRSVEQSRRHSRSSGNDGLLRSDDGLLSDVVEEIVERDRRKMQKEVTRVLSFGWGVVTWYGNCSLYCYIYEDITIGASKLTCIRVLQFRSWQYHCFLFVWPSTPYPTPLLPTAGQCCFHRRGTRNVPSRALIRVSV
jgi:hypothetical protein